MSNHSLAKRIAQSLIQSRPRTGQTKLMDKVPSWMDTSTGDAYYSLLELVGASAFPTKDPEVIRLSKQDLSRLEKQLQDPSLSPRTLGRVIGSWSRFPRTAQDSLYLIIDEAIISLIKRKSSKRSSQNGKSIRDEFYSRPERPEVGDRGVADMEEAGTFRGQIVSIGVNGDSEFPIEVLCLDGNNDAGVPFGEIMNISASQFTNNRPKSRH